MGYLDQVLEEFDQKIRNGDSVDNISDDFNMAVSGQFIKINEAEYNRKIDKLHLEILDIDKFIKVNEVKRITNPVFYSRDNVPTSDGLLSNEIFGITRDDRAGIFGYISLENYYIDPSCYKCWCKIDSIIKDVVHKVSKYRVDETGKIVEDPKGKNGVKFLKDNIDKIKFRTSESIKRDLKVRYLEKNRYKMFINKYLVIPPYYRDTNTGKRSVGVGGINELYSKLIIAVNSTTTPFEYGFDCSGINEGRVQETLVAIYDWFCGNSNETMKVEKGVGIAGKMGILHRSVLTKTINYSARLVITGPELKANRPEDMMVNFEYSAIPLAACIACFRPYIQYWVRRFFDNEFVGTEQYPVMNKNGEISYEYPKDPLIVFSDERIKSEMETFINGYNNRFVPIEVPLEDASKKVYMQFKGRFANDNRINEPIFNRRLTWCDIFYMAACEVVQDKYCSITRYPVNRICGLSLT